MKLETGHFQELCKASGCEINKSRIEPKDGAEPNNGTQSDDDDGSEFERYPFSILKLHH